jgi:hypothetical protein
VVIELERQPRGRWIIEQLLDALEQRAVPQLQHRSDGFVQRAHEQRDTREAEDEADGDVEDRAVEHGGSLGCR